MSKKTANVNADQMRRDIEKYAENIFYSARYSDDEFEYRLVFPSVTTERELKLYDRHVILPKPLVKYLPKDRLATEEEWRGLGIRQSPGWEHYMIHQPEPHILLFKREKDYQVKYPAA